MTLAFGKGEYFGDVVEALQSRLAKWQGPGLEALWGYGWSGGHLEPRPQELVYLALQRGAALAPAPVERSRDIGIEA
jgi:hypothetical protein